MFQIPGFDHRTGHHCGSTALRNLTEFHGWDLGEAACFGLGGGIASVAIDRDDGEWQEFLGRPLWLETQFFEIVDISHDVREGDAFEEAWDDVTGRIENEDPVLLFLDPTEMSNVPESEHAPPHAVLAIGYDDEALLLSDASEPEPVAISKADLRRAWSGGRIRDLDHRYLVVTEPAATVDVEAAANRALRETTTYMLDTRSYERTNGAIGDHGPDAVRSFATNVETWSDLEDPARPARQAHDAITEHGRGAAFRRFFADAMEALAPEAGIGGPPAERMRTIAEEWEAAAGAFAAAVNADDDADREVALSEAAGALNDAARRETRFFKHVRQEF